MIITRRGGNSTPKLWKTFQKSKSKFGVLLTLSAPYYRPIGVIMALWVLLARQYLHANKVLYVNNTQRVILTCFVMLLTSRADSITKKSPVTVTYVRKLYLVAYKNDFEIKIRIYYNVYDNTGRV